MTEEEQQELQEELVKVSGDQGLKGWRWFRESRSGSGVGTEKDYIFQTTLIAVFGVCNVCFEHLLISNKGRLCSQNSPP